ncbi:MAG: flagellar type III secretion system protein FlhB [Rhodospirillales bacterium]|nr:flagellar type III secretion system protein FlhB [Rhodospirillales bacterium]
MAEEAGERTEQPTPRRLAKAAESGDLPLSPEAQPFAVLAGAAALAALAGGAAMARAARGLAWLLDHLDTLTPAAASRRAIWIAGSIALPLGAVVALAAVAAVGVQTGLRLRPAALMPDIARLSPRRGLARLGGIGALGEAGRSLLKLAVLSLVAWYGLTPSMAVLSRMFAVTALGFAATAGGMLLHLLAAAALAQGGLALLDHLRARRAWIARLRMTRQELREEHREAEGDPATKARRRRLQMARGRRRMMAAVPRAAVVVTNPTHYAVALAYERDRPGAPRVVAKGMDEVAARIREVAREARVPIVPNPPLARALHAVELDQEIPSALYRAVAELIAGIWRVGPYRQSV